MTSFSDEIAADLADAIGGYGQTFQWKGNTYPCVRNTQPADFEFMAGGEVIKVEYTLLVAIAAFGAPGAALPQIGDMVDGNAAQIKKIDPNIGQLILHCGTPDV